MAGQKWEVIQLEILNSKPILAGMNESCKYSPVQREERAVSSEEGKGV